MANTMKLSEAIRLGATMKPQAFGFFLYDGKSCALGAAVDAVGQLTKDGVKTLHVVNALWPDAYQSATCHLCGQTHAMIVHLNNDHEWTREQIADWLEARETAPTELPVLSLAAREQSFLASVRTLATRSIGVE